jgi:hypothetical protein
MEALSVRANFPTEMTNKIMNDEIPTIEIPADLDWVDWYSGTVLHSVVRIWGVPYNVEAIAVDKSGKARGRAAARRLALLKRLKGVDCELCAVTLKPGRHYVISFVPFDVNE